LLNAEKEFAEQVKPFNFLLSAHVRPFGYPDGVDPKAFHLIAPYERNPRKWTRLPWVDRGSGTGVKITTAGATGGPGLARVKTYQDVIGEFQHHPEAKAADQHGYAGQRGTMGLLQRRQVRPYSLIQLGKESNQLEEVEAGLAHDLDEIWTEYADPRRNPWRELVLPVLKNIPANELAVATGLSVRSVKAARNGRTEPRVTHRARFTAAAGAFSRDLLQRADHCPPREDLTACAVYLETVSGPTG
jgi:hypothetical protein